MFSLCSCSQSPTINVAGTTMMRQMWRSEEWEEWVMGGVGYGRSGLWEGVLWEKWVMGEVGYGRSGLREGCVMGGVGYGRSEEWEEWVMGEVRSGLWEE